MMVKSVSRTRVTTFKGNLPSGREDGLAVEEPLEIRVGGRSLTVVMRTPGHDVELAAGLLLSEGIVSSAAQIGAIAHCRDPKDPQHENVLDVRLVPGVSVDWRRLKRSFFSNTSCGLCGKTTIESVKVSTPPLPEDVDGAWVAPEVLLRLPLALRAAQRVFEETGGLHACGLFDERGKLLLLREDVGRHNAVDKTIGAALLSGMIPLSRHLVMVSGRASFEIVQKVLVARVPVVCAVSAPSSLAVDLAREANMTLVGFLREKSFNVYSEAGRIEGCRIAPAVAGGDAPPVS